MKELQAERPLTNDTCLDAGQLTAEGNAESSTPLTNQWEACRDAEAWLRLAERKVGLRPLPPTVTRVTVNPPRYPPNSRK